jgi:hypothetical protein
LINKCTRQEPFSFQTAIHSVFFFSIASRQHKNAHNLDNRNFNFYLKIGNKQTEKVKLLNLTEEIFCVKMKEEKDERLSQQYSSQQKRKNN